MDIHQAATEVHVQTSRYRLEFRRTGDRWGHVLFVAGARVLESLESPPEERAPESPAFQDLLVERGTPDTCEIQLFGQCGKQVYSAAVQCTAEQVHFDVSVRDRNDAPVSATSRYRIANLPGFEIVAELGDRIWHQDLLEIQSVEVAASRQGRTRRWIYRVEI